MFNNFREFLTYLEEHGQLLRVKEEVDVRFDVAAGIRKTSDLRGPALLFERIKGYPGWKIAAALFATRKLIAMALGVPEEKLLEKYASLERESIPPRPVKSGPVKEIVIKGADVDLRKLPIVTHSERDCGPYITIGVQFGKDLETGAGNASIHRMLVLDRDRLTLWAPPDHHLGRFIARAEDRGQGLPVATAIGVDPRIIIASQAKAPMGVDELHIAGGMRGSPVEVVKCETIPLEVPADAEIVIEGVTIPKLRATDGPFGEYAGCYSSKQAPVVQVTAITMRRDPIYHTCLTGFPVTENHCLIELPNLTRIYQDVRRIVPEVKGVHLTAGGAYRHHVVVSIRKRHDEEARNVILGLLAAGIGIKQVIVVDDDIDVSNPVEVEWAVSTRVQPDRDIIIVPRITSSILDPSAPKPRTIAGWGIDATAPLDNREGYEKVIVPGVDKVRYL